MFLENNKMESPIEAMDGIQWDDPGYTYCGKPFVPYVWGGELAEIASGNFNALTISLDGKIHSDLSWQLARQTALNAVQQGLFILWHLDLGLFDGLPLPLVNQTQFLSLGLALTHFKETLWIEFKSKTIGICLYKGCADFSQTFTWDAQQLANFKEWLEQLFNDVKEFKEEVGASSMELSALKKTEKGMQLIRLFCRDASMEYLGLLAAQLSDELPVYLFLDASSLALDPLKQLQLLHPESVSPLNLAIKGCNLPIQGWGWENFATPIGYCGQNLLQLPAKLDVKIGVCIPSLAYCKPSHWEGIGQALEEFGKRGIEYKLMAEENLITNWDGLDFLIYTPSVLSFQGKRKLQGFCAAGGTVVSTGDLLGLPYEMTMQQFLTESPPLS
ncbi:MAG: hypothetical protein H0V82_02625 [Candidatus Protochlamydia sp.]|nr:hypothetical protein [Candidatus Protochlamydia sp.]